MFKKIYRNNILKLLEIIRKIKIMFKRDLNEIIIMKFLSINIYI